jgi:hypothetical protein
MISRDGPGGIEDSPPSTTGNGAGARLTFPTEKKGLAVPTWSLAVPVDGVIDVGDPPGRRARAPLPARGANPSLGPRVVRPCPRPVVVRADRPAVSARVAPCTPPAPQNAPLPHCLREASGPGTMPAVLAVSRPSLLAASPSPRARPGTGAWHWTLPGRRRATLGRACLCFVGYATVKRRTI